VLAEFAGQRVGSSGAAFDDFGDGVVAMDFTEPRGKRFAVIVLTTSTDENLHSASPKGSDFGFAPLRTPAPST
jgi:hypothetical protein